MLPSFFNKEFIYNLPKIISSNNCWLYTGAISSGGYACIKIDQIQYKIHRLVGVIFHDIDYDNKKQLACHTCDIKRCFNPEHIYKGNNSTNQRDAVKRKRHKEAKKTHCSRGHEYTAENTRVCGKKRQCRMCDPIKNKLALLKRNKAKIGKR